jgi:hypothetical protein
MIRNFFLLVSLILTAAKVPHGAEAQTAPKTKPTGTKAAAPSPNIATRGETRVMIYSVCAGITVLTGWKTGATAAVKVNGKELGNVEACSFRSFGIPAGEHELRLLTYDAIFGAIDFGLPVAKNTFPAGKTTYIRAVAGQYISWSIVDEKTGLDGIAAIKSINAKK